MERKTFTLKDADLLADGSFTALFSKFNDIDKQGDLTLPGAFGDQKVIISAYGHTSWDGALPVGKGRIFESAEGGVVEAKFFLDTIAGKDTYTTIKNVGELQEFSYSLPEIESEMRTIDGENVRILKKITVNEVSPVLRGAGNGTHLIDIKSHGPLAEHLKTLSEEARDALTRLQEVAKKRETERRHPSQATLAEAATLKAIFEDLVRGFDQILCGHSEVMKEFVRFNTIIAQRR
jgi:hypothetical protein